MTEEGSGKSYGEEQHVQLPAKWYILLDRLYESDADSLDEILPELIALIQSTRPKLAEIGLASVLQSPPVRRCSPHFELATAATVLPGYLVADDFADAARFPIGDAGKNARRLARELFREYAKDKALTVQEAVEYYENVARVLKLEHDSDEAILRRASRARKRLFISQSRGRPKKIGHK